MTHKDLRNSLSYSILVSSIRPKPDAPQFVFRCCVEHPYKSSQDIPECQSKQKVHNKQSITYV